MKSSQKSKLGKVGVGSNLLRITHLTSRKSYLFIIYPNSHDKLSNRLGKVIMFPLFGFIYSYFAPIYHFGPDLVMYLYFPIFSFIYL